MMIAIHNDDADYDDADDDDNDNDDEDDDLLGSVEVGRVSPEASA